MQIDEFFAVTETSVYHVRTKGDDGEPCVVKIALRGNSSIPVGQRLSKTQMISIGKQIIGYIPEKYGSLHQLTGVERDISRVNTTFWGGNTSFVVALFENEADAMKCFDSSDLKPCDSRWIGQTKRVLELIGENHPVFFIPHDDLTLIPH